MGGVVFQYCVVGGVWWYQWLYVGMCIDGYVQQCWVGFGQQCGQVIFYVVVVVDVGCGDVEYLC